MKESYSVVLFKQKTAYEMRISDWSSDVCSSDLAAHNRGAGGSSRRIARALLMAEPPRAEAGEITDKGYVNQRATLARRAALVDRLYGEPPGDDVIVVS